MTKPATNILYDLGFLFINLNLWQDVSIIPDDLDELFFEKSKFGKAGQTFSLI